MGSEEDLSVQPQVHPQPALAATLSSVPPSWLSLRLNVSIWTQIPQQLSPFFPAPSIFFSTSSFPSHTNMPEYHTFKKKIQLHSFGPIFLQLLLPFSAPTTAMLFKRDLSRHRHCFLTVHTLPNSPKPVVLYPPL